MTTTRTGLPCDQPDCGSSDAKAEYEDGGTYCFSCHHYERGKTGLEVDLPWETETETEVETIDPDYIPTQGTSRGQGVPARGLVQGTLDYYGVETTHDLTNGEVTGLVFPVYRAGERVGEKEKNLADKNYFARGSTKSPDLFGSWQCREGGKLLIITEGEEDCMSAHQLLKQAGKNYNVVSLPTGANVSSIRKNLEWIESFDTITLNLDADKVGADCAKEIADIITPGKVKVMTLPVKDANDYLLSKASGMDYLKQVWAAKPYRPDGVVSLSDSWDLMWASDQQTSVPFPWQGLNDKLYGMREREIVTWTGGSGIGKSAVVRELEHWLLKQTEDNIGILALEESVARTAWGIVSVEANLPLSIREERGGVSENDIKGWWDATLGTGRLFTLDHFGSTSQANLLNRVRYMIKGLQCKWIVLDHLSIVVSAMDDMGDERKAIDSIMTKLRQMCEETGAGLHLVSHLRRVDGNRGHEQGIEVSLAHLRGSQAIAQLSDSVVAMERNQQAATDKEANLTRLRVLKNRYAGLTGIASHLAYVRATGRLEEVHNVEEYLAPSPDEVYC